MKNLFLLAQVLSWLNTVIRDWPVPRFFCVKGVLLAVLGMRLIITCVGEADCSCSGKAHRVRCGVTFIVDEFLAFGDAEMPVGP